MRAGLIQLTESSRQKRAGEGPTVAAGWDLVGRAIPTRVTGQKSHGWRGMADADGVPGRPAYTNLPSCEAKSSYFTMSERLADKNGSKC